MSHYAFTFQGEILHALASGALFWPKQNLFCVSDLHFGKAQRYATQGGSTLPPYDTLDTLTRLSDDISNTMARTVICLGDSFDRVGASDDMDDQAHDWITRLQAGRDWLWIEGNHDPGPIGLGGIHLANHTVGSISFRHITDQRTRGEISGHYHPKVSLKLSKRNVSKRCFIVDEDRIIMPAFGTYTGGLSVLSEPLVSIMKRNSTCILTGLQALPIPRPNAT
ncbi:ligase-associated DNA damage response endonuclease PdeM [Planktotalea sp.]|uniref:ligase-associated DNA damage response endonuclease PdeM n=1 Tax=Planktotalea sp. TaxID=2029877 RepID=UPI0026010B7F|nr:ligase-associated DNA damage response endonuclease PdeM [Planktotalea sp.]